MAGLGLGDVRLGEQRFPNGDLHLRDRCLFRPGDCTESCNWPGTVGLDASCGGAGDRLAVACAWGGRRRAMLLASILVTAGATALVWFARPAPTSALWALIFIGMGTVAFELGTVFYNAMLPEVVP